MGGSDRIRCLDDDVFTALRSVRPLEVASARAGDPCALSGGTTVTYDLDPTGRRIGRYTGATSTYWLYESRLRLAAQLDGERRITQRCLHGQRPNGPEVTVTYNPVTGAETGRWRVLTEIRGSVRGLVNAATGEVDQWRTYGPWGQLLDEWTAPSTPSHPFGFAGGHWDAATGLVRFGARDCDPTIGRWTARDPVGFEGGDTNLHAYVGGDPVGAIDPTGLAVPAAVVGAAAGAGCGMNLFMAWVTGSLDDFGDCAASCVAGAVGGATSVFGPLGGAVGGVAGSVIQDFGMAERGEPPSGEDVVIGAVLGGFIGFALGGVVGSRADEGVSFVTGVAWPAWSFAADGVAEIGRAL